MNNRIENRGIQDTQTILKDYLKKIIHNGDIAVDATAGRGRDTLFLARCVGTEGRVFAFDIQAEAIQATRELLEKHGMLDRVMLLPENHSKIANYVPQGIKAAIFNLGYLPGWGKEIITQPASTLKAVAAVLDLLLEQGIIAITVYRGHDGGLEESRALDAYLSELPKKDFSVLQGIYLNQGELSPYWIMIQKTGRTMDENPSSKKDPGINQ